MAVLRWGSEKVVGTSDDTMVPREADVAGLADGGYVVVWEDDSATQRVLAQRFDAQGSLVGEQIVVANPGDPAGIEYFAPQVAALANGGFAVSFTSSAGAHDAWVRAYSAAGTFTGGSAFTTPGLNESEGAIASFGSSYLHAYQYGDDIRVFGMTVNSDAMTGVQEAPSIAEIANGTRYVVTWLDQNGGNNYRYRVFNADNTPVTGTFAVNAFVSGAVSGDRPATVVGLSDGGFVVTWTDSTLQDANLTSIHARMFDASGSPTTNEFVVNSVFKGAQAFPDVAALPDGGFVALWSDSSKGPSALDYDIVGQMFDRWGTRIGRQFTVNTGTDGTGGQLDPHVSALADGRMVVEWHSAATGEIRTQIIDPREGVVEGTDSADALYGHTQAEDEISGRGGADALNGLGGNDTLYGGDGNDVLRGGIGADYLDGGSGIDTASYFNGSVGIAVSLVTGLGSGGEAQDDTLVSVENLSGSQGNDSLVGDTGANALQGWNGNDVLTGAGGKDTLTGGAGADRFVYSSTAQSAVGANADVIADFSHAQADKIDLAAIDANTGVAGNQAFSFIGAAVYSGVAGQLRTSTVGSVTTVAGDVNGDSVSDFHIQLTGAIALVAGDFVL